MSNEVYANTRELACAAGNGKTICATPDVCFTPPENPATPPGVPVPYPNSAFASDTTDGSKTVQISGKEVMLKNQSYFKKSSGDEAGCAAKKGAVSSSTSGKVYFVAWSMDVKLEGENAVRHLDMTTNNHACPLANEAVPWPFMDKQHIGSGKDPCEAEKRREQKACKDFKKQGKKNVCAAASMNIGIKKARAKGVDWNKLSANAIKGKEPADKCLRARKCRLVPYKQKKDGKDGCCPSQTPDHLVPKSSFFKASVSKAKKLAGWSKYSVRGAPCMCAEGPSNTEGSHGLRHAAHKFFGDGKEGKTVSFASEVNLAVKSAQTVFKSSNCSNKCLKAQLYAGHEDMCKTDLSEAEVKHSPSGTAADSLKDLQPLKALSAGG